MLLLYRYSTPRIHHIFYTFINPEQCVIEAWWSIMYFSLSLCFEMEVHCFEVHILIATGCSFEVEHLQENYATFTTTCDDVGSSCILSTMVSSSSLIGPGILPTGSFNLMIRLLMTGFAFWIFLEKKQSKKYIFGNVFL